MPGAAGRRLERSKKFEKALQSSADKDGGLHEQVDKALASRLERGPASKDHQLKGFKGLPLYKMRIPAQGSGKSGGARIVYYCDHELLFALRIFLKSKKANLSPADRKQIEDDLLEAGLWPK